MADDELGIVRRFKEENGRLMKENQALKSGGGDGTSGTMEARVSRLEQRADKLADDVANIRSDLATLTERVSHLPSKGYIDARLLAMLTVIAALILFADKIKALLG